MALTRTAGRTPEDIRSLTIEPHFSPYAEGSCLICVGNTLLQEIRGNLAEISRK